MLDDDEITEHMSKHYLMMTKQELVDSMVFSLVQLILKNPYVEKKYVVSALQCALEDLQGMTK